MTSLIKDGVILNYADTAAAPCKDFCQIYVTLDHVIIRRWKITIREHASVNPTEIKDTHQEFLDDDRAHTEIFVAFGQSMVDYIIGLAEGKIDYLNRLPQRLLVKIVDYLHLEDIRSLSQVNKQLKELCDSEELWQRWFRTHTHGPVTAELETLAEAIGWKKLFFTNKLQLQVLLKRIPPGELQDAAWARKLEKESHYHK